MQKGVYEIQFKLIEEVNWMENMTLPISSTNDLLAL